MEDTLVLVELIGEFIKQKVLLDKGAKALGDMLNITGSDCLVYTGFTKIEQSSYNMVEAYIRHFYGDTNAEIFGAWVYDFNCGEQPLEITCDGKEYSISTVEELINYITKPIKF